VYRTIGKRLLDILGAGIALVVSAPALLIVAAAVHWRLGRPVFFTQTRPGWHGRPFRMIKFRTMSDARDARGELLPDRERLDAFGRLLRSTSLDELPELWNVVRGDMSLVGPRPLLTEYLEQYTPQQMRRHDVRPGITGLAQVNGRNALSWEEKFSWDLEYVRRSSFSVDLGILTRTVGQVVSQRAINQPGHATAEKFVGARRP
jgi:sugar transferase EpsL